MSAIHVLTGRNGLYTVVVHINTPAGNNSAGVLWSDAIKNSGRAKSVMAVGTGAGQITSAELAQVTAGTVIEGVFQWQDDPLLTNPQRVTALNAVASQTSTELLARYADELKFYGFAQ